MTSQQAPYNVIWPPRYGYHLQAMLYITLKIFSNRAMQFAYLRVLQRNYMVNIDIWCWISNANYLPINTLWFG